MTTLVPVAVDLCSKRRHNLLHIALVLRNELLVALTIAEPHVHERHHAVVDRLSCDTSRDSVRQCGRGVGCGGGGGDERRAVDAKQRCEGSKRG